MDRLLEHIHNHPLLVSFALVAAIAVLVFEFKTRNRGYSAVQPQEAIALMNKGAQVYDLRNKEAFGAGHVNGAKHLDPEQQGNAAETLKRLKERTLLLICEDGQAATKLTRQLHAGGFTKVFNLRGGLAAWRAEGLPLQRG
jgi:rhodanese-related sulfurtransferase